MINLEKVKTIVCGIQGSGKTFFTEHEIVSSFKRPLVYLMHPEDFRSCKSNVHVYIPKRAGGSVDVSRHHLEYLAPKIKEMGQKGMIDAFILDEADMFLPKRLETLQKFPAIYDLIINHRHYGLALVFVTRRPQSIPTEIAESCEHWFVFIIEGDNVLKKFKAIHPKFEELLPKLDKAKHNFIHKKLGQDPTLCSAITVTETKQLKGGMKHEKKS